MEYYWKCLQQHCFNNVNDLKILLQIPVVVEHGRNMQNVEI